MKKVMIIINPTSGGETALDYKESLENKAKKYFDYVETKICLLYTSFEWAKQKLFINGLISTVGSLVLYLSLIHI